MPRDTRTFFQLITAAIADMEQNGYDSQERVDAWMELIRDKLAETMPSIGRSAEKINERMRQEYERLVDRGGLIRANPTISLFTLERIKPSLRAELDRRIMASASLIKLNRARSMEQTLQRFAGWATSIPPGGSSVNDRKQTKVEIRKPLAQLPFEERRVAIDQGLKLSATIHDLTATASNAIAAEWHSKWKQQGYNYRPDHKDRDGKIYAIRDSWADKAGLINKGGGYTDEMTKPAEEVYCQCKNRYIYALRQLPPEMLTEKGMAELRRVSEKANQILGVK